MKEKAGCLSGVLSTRKQFFHRRRIRWQQQAPIVAGRKAIALDEQPDRVALAREKLRGHLLRTGDGYHGVGDLKTDLARIQIQDTADIVGPLDLENQQVSVGELADVHQGDRGVVPEDRPANGKRPKLWDSLPEGAIETRALNGFDGDRRRVV